jgi:hypothetical protein
MESLASTLANNTELTVDLSPGVFVEQVYDRSSTNSGSQVTVPLGAFAASERKTLLVRLRVPRGPAGERPVAAVRLRYDDLTQGQPGTSEGTLVAQLTDDASQVAPLDGLVSARLSSSETAAVLEEANELFRSGRADAARQLVVSKGGVLSESRRKARATARDEDGGDLDKSFDRQEQALAGAAGGFSQPPPPAADPAVATGAEGETSPASPAAEPAASRPAKARVRANQKDAFDLAE